MARGRLATKALRERLKGLGYSWNDIGRYEGGVLPEYDDEGYMKKDTAFSEGMTKRLYQFLIRDKIIATNEFATPKKKVIVIKYLGFLREQAIHSNKLKESILKIHWHDDGNRDDVINELLRRQIDFKKILKRKG